jgi:hypothetical protein
MNNKKNTNRIRRDFYLTFFKKQDGYEELQVNGYWLIKQFDGGTKEWTVHLYSPESYKNYIIGKEKWKDMQQNKLI